MLWHILQQTAYAGTSAGRDPNKLVGGEQLRAPYHRAARYPDEQASEAPYDQAQQTIYETPCDLSVYRLRLGPELTWHVAVLGNPPDEDLNRRIEEILTSGEQVPLPDEVLVQLAARRREQSNRGPWVEAHHFPRRRRTR
jgi:hypothetical protein